MQLVVVLGAKTSQIYTQNSLNVLLSVAIFTANYVYTLFWQVF